METRYTDEQLTLLWGYLRQSFPAYVKAAEDFEGYAIVTPTDIDTVVWLEQTDAGLTASVLARDDLMFLWLESESRWTAVGSSLPSATK